MTEAYLIAIFVFYVVVNQLQIKDLRTQGKERMFITLEALEALLVLIEKYEARTLRRMRLPSDRPATGLDKDIENFTNQIKAGHEYNRK